MEDGLLSPIVVNTATGVEERSVCKTSLCGGFATRGVAETAAVVETTFGVDGAALLVSATLAWGCGLIVTAGDDETGSGAEATIENWPMEADDDATIVGGGVVAASEACTWGAWDTCDDNTDAEDKTEVKVLVVLELVCVFTSVLGNAVHLLPPSVVIKAPTGKFGLVPDMTTRASPVAISQSKGSKAHCATGA